MKLASVCLVFLVQQIAGFKLQSFSLKDLQEPTPEAVVRLQKAIAQIGMFAVESDESANTLQQLVACVQSGGASAHSQDVILKDQTVRTTLAVVTNASGSLPFAKDLQTACPGFVEASDALRMAAAKTGSAYAQFLDRLAGDHEEGPFQKAVSLAQSLEHFHVYRRRGELKPGAEPTLKMHTDMGLFIVMTPPRYFDLASYNSPTHAVDSGFRLKLRSGEVVTPELPAGSLLVMNGEGGPQWISSHAAEGLYAPPHEVVLPSISGLGRAWYGRMYLPPPAAKKSEDAVPFGQFWTEGSAAVIRAPLNEMLLDGPGRRLLVDQGNCSAGQLYCWMACRSTENVSTCPTKDIVCTDPNGKSWPENYRNATTGQPTHCFSCALRCNSTTGAAVMTSPSAVMAGLLLFIAALLLH